MNRPRVRKIIFRFKSNSQAMRAFETENMAVEKLKEAKFFLQKMKDEGGGKEVQYYYSAFMSASRSFFDYIEPDEDSDLYDLWESEVEPRLHGDTDKYLLSYMRDHRNDIIHEKLPETSLIGLSLEPSDESPVDVTSMYGQNLESDRLFDKYREHEVVNSMHKFKSYPKGYEGHTLLMLCKEYFKEIEDIAELFITEYGSQRKLNDFKQD